jgi:hypothetical protein
MRSPREGEGALSQEGAPSETELETRLLADLRRHLQGIRAKVAADFSEANFQQELAKLEGDPVYAQFGLAAPPYVLVRLMGRLSISIGRRLGEIYDKIPRFLAAARFRPEPSDIAPLFNGLQIDLCLEMSKLSEVDVAHVTNTIAAYPTIPWDDSKAGVGIEIRYNFNPNDSARLRKDCDMAGYVAERGLVPIYLIFSSISPRDEAIARLERAGWCFLVGAEATRFAETLLGLNLAEILNQPRIKQEVMDEVADIMRTMVASHSFQQVLNPPTDTV